MENKTELARLEEFVDKLLTKYNQLKTDYHALQETLQERDNECVDLMTNIEELTSERTEVGSRVAGLIGRIEQWEVDQGGSNEGGMDDQGGFQESLFNEGAEEHKQNEEFHS